MIGAPNREGDTKDARLSVRIEPSVKETLKRLAFDSKLSLSAYIQRMAYRQITAEGLEDYDEEPPTPTGRSTPSDEIVSTHAATAGESCDATRQLGTATVLPGRPSSWIKAD